jgi:hypothetical protein
MIDFRHDLGRPPVRERHPVPDSGARLVHRQCGYEQSREGAIVPLETGSCRDGALSYSGLCR